MNAKGDFSLNELAFIHGTDKGSKQIERANLSPKNYAVHYEQRFGHLKNDEFTLVEIGVNSGASIRMWHEYFHRAQIVGIDIRIDSEKLGDIVDSDRIHLVSGDQGDIRFLSSFKEYLRDGFPPVAVIVDDGCHKRASQARSFEYLFHRVLDHGGYYAIEDLQADVQKGEDLLMGEIVEAIQWRIPNGVIDPPVEWIRFYPRMVMIRKAHLIEQWSNLQETD